MLSTQDLNQMSQRHWLQSLGSRYWIQTSTADCSITIPITFNEVEVMKKRNISTGINLTNGFSQSTRGPLLTKLKSDDDIFLSGTSHLSKGKKSKTNKHKKRAISPHQMNSDSSSQVLPLSSIFPGVMKVGSASPQSQSSSSNYNLSMTFEAHAIYLMQSGLIARLFSDSKLTEQERQADLLDSPLRHLPLEKRPRIMTSPWFSKYILYLPVPDATSVSHILHYMYHGTLESLLEALKAKSITWQGVMANVEFLELEGNIQEDLFKVYRQRLG